MRRKSKRFLFTLAEWLGPWIIRLIGWSLRIQRINPEAVQKFIEEKRGFVFCVWHGRMFAPVFYHRNQGIVAMISHHADGEMVTRIVKKLGYGAVRGSSTRGGTEAYYEMLARLKEGGIAAMLPDGPTGPRLKFKSGSLYLAQHSGNPVIPITFAARPCWRFKSWDRFVLPKPFARCAIYHGDPITIPEEIPSEEVESWREKLEGIMVDLVKSAEAHFGGTEADV